MKKREKAAQVLRHQDGDRAKEFGGLDLSEPDSTTITAGAQAEDYG